MSVSVAGIQRNRCRTTIPERMEETLAELPFTGDQVGLFRAQPGRLLDLWRPVAGGHRAARQHGDRGSDARAQRQHAVIRCGTGHDPAVAARCGAAGDAGGAMARSAAPDQEAGPRHRVQPRAGQKASALSRADRRCRGQPRRTEIFFAHEHLREDLQGVSRHFHALAHHLAEVVPEGPEETVLLGTVTPEL